MILLSTSEARQIIDENSEDALIVEDFTEEGETVYRIQIKGKIRELISVYEKEWREEFDSKIYNGKKFPYTVSPATQEIIDLLHRQFSKELSEKTGIEDEESWAKGKVRDVGQRVMMPDAYWLIGVHNAPIIADWMKKIKDSGKKPLFRSLGCGAGVYERSIFEFNSNIIGITTDLKLDSCIRAALNFELIGISDGGKRVDHTIYIGKKIPKEFLDKERHLLIQCSDALEALREEKVMKDKGEIEGYSAFGMDNFLPYLDLSYVNEIFERVLTLGKEEFLIQFLGLDRTRVEISVINKLGEILRGSAFERFKKLVTQRRQDLNKVGRDYRFGYKAIYQFDNDGIVRRVISPWAGNIYDWIRGYLLRGEVKKMGVLMRQINRATGLSALVELVESETIEHFDLLKEILQKQNMREYDIVVSPGSIEEDGRLVLRTSTIVVR